MSSPFQTPPPPLHVLVLQGGSALGAYQAGTYEAMEEAGVQPRRLSEP
ncbi:hypothetical protein WN982_10430 [Paraburkholderia sp. IMGN_8]